MQKDCSLAKSGGAAVAPPFHIVSLLSTPQHLPPPTGDDFRQSAAHPQSPSSCTNVGGCNGSLGSDSHSDTEEWTWICRPDNSEQAIPICRRRQSSSTPLPFSAGLRTDSHQVALGPLPPPQVLFQVPNTLHPPPPPPPFLYPPPPPSVLHVHYQLSASGAEQTFFEPLAATAATGHSKCSGSPRSRRLRALYTPTQLRTLEDAFAESHYVNREERQRLSRQIGVTEKQVKMWFQNRRTKLKKEKSLRHKCK